MHFTKRTQKGGRVVEWLTDRLSVGMGMCVCVYLYLNAADIEI